MIPQDNLIDIFLYNPCDESYNEITNKELALELLMKQPNSTQGMYFLRIIGNKIGDS